MPSADLSGRHRYARTRLPCRVESAPADTCFRCGLASIVPGLPDKKESCTRDEFVRYHKRAHSALGCDAPRRSLFLIGNWSEEYHMGLPGKLSSYKSLRHRL